MEPLDRRAFLVTTGAAAASLAATTPMAAQADTAGAVFLSTWRWGIEANKRAAEVFSSGGTLLDAVEKGINVVEDDPNVTSVGYGGLPNAEGEVELDAALWTERRTARGRFAISTRSRIRSRWRVW